MRSLTPALVVLIVVTLPGHAKDFDTHPPTTTLNGATAFTLNRGEWRGGSLNFYFSFPTASTIFSLSQLQWLGVEYGLTNRLQIGTTVLENVLQGPNVRAKFNALRTRTLAVMMPLAIDVDLSPFAAGIGSGFSISWSPTGTAALHTGIRFWAYDGQVQLSRIHAALEYALLDHTHLFAEVDVWPLVVEVGSLSRFRALNLEVSTRLVEDAAPHLDLELELFVRF